MRNGVEERGDLPSGVEYPNGNLSFENIHKRFAESKHGEKLRGEIRFKPYKTEALTSEQWCRLLGADVNNLHHMSLTRGLAASFLRRVPHVDLSQFDLEVLLLTAQVHDWAEAVKGDIPYDHKKKVMRKMSRGY